MTVRDQIVVRHRYTSDVIAYFEKHPREWIPVVELARVGGFAAWRTRVSEARKHFEARGGTVIWNGKTRDSAYRYLPHVPLGRDASAPIDQQGLF